MGFGHSTQNVNLAPGQRVCSMTHISLFTSMSTCYTAGNPPKPVVQYIPDDKGGSSIPGHAPAVADWGSTKVRITIGSHETEKMGGGFPGIALFTEFGERVGQTPSARSSSREGGFRDIEVKHGMRFENNKPTYLYLAGADVPICISSVALEYPDGTKQMITGDDLSWCDDSPSYHLRTQESRTYIGSQFRASRCFWVEGNNAGDKAVRGVSFHLPDFVWTPARQQAYKDNKELLCATSPRFWKYGSTAEDWTLKDPILIFNPVLQYDATTGLDVDPSRITDWHYPKEKITIFSDRQFVTAASHQSKRRSRVMRDTYVHNATTDTMGTVINAKDIDAGLVKLKPFISDVDNTKDGSSNATTPAGPTFEETPLANATTVDDTATTDGPLINTTERVV